jgi:hypothetical protein
LVAAQIGSDPARCFLAAAIEGTFMVARAGFRPGRFRVTQQQDTAHDCGHRFYPAERLAYGVASAAQGMTVMICISSATT